MKKYLFLFFFSVTIANVVFAQVSAPERLSVSISPVVPIDLSNLSEAEMDNPLNSLQDTSMVDITVLFRIDENENESSIVHIQVGSNGNTSNVFDQELSLYDSVPSGIERQGGNGFYSFYLGNYPYNGGLNVRIRAKGNDGNYSVFIED